MRIGLVASGGGHVRQLLDLERLWSQVDCFFVTEDTALTRDIAGKHKTYFIPHVALGQARLGKPHKMIWAAIVSFFKSLHIIWRERPDAIITTGAGSSYFPILFARILGAKIVLIDSFARFRGPSAFARIAAPLAHVRIAQSEQAGTHWPGSIVFDPFQYLKKPRPVKEPLVFATVGATLPFDRLVKLVNEAKIAGDLPEKVILQTGVGCQVDIDPSIEVHETLPFEQVLEILKKADIVICHGGTGSIITALREGCRVITVPRSFERGEHYDNHQWEIGSAFAGRGILTMVGNDDDMAGALANARRTDPICATLDPSSLIAELESLIQDWDHDKVASGSPATQLDHKQPVPVDPGS